MLHALISVQSVGDKGQGLIASALIKKGTLVWEEEPGGATEKYTKAELAKLPPEKARLAYWDSGQNSFVMGTNDPSDYMNHSCDPNLGWSGEYQLIAVRDIQPNEEVTYDYATSDIHGINGKPELKCLCGSANCRKIIHPDDLLRYPELQVRYKGLLPPSIVAWMKSVV